MGGCVRLVGHDCVELVVGEVSDVDGGTVMSECASGVAVYVRLFNHAHNRIVRSGDAGAGVRKSEVPSCCAASESVVRAGTGNVLPGVVDVPGCELPSWEWKMRVFMRWLCVLEGVNFNCPVCN